MRKSFTLVFTLFVLHYSFSQEITATQKFPETVNSGGEYTVEIIINKTNINGFVKFFQGIPEGCIAKSIESKGGNFSFSDGGAKIIWINLPSENEFTISYQVSVPKEVSGIKNINGKIAYVINNERKVLDLETKTIKIGSGDLTKKKEIVLATSGNQTKSNSSPIGQPKEEIKIPTKINSDSISKKTIIPINTSKEKNVDFKSLAIAPENETTKERKSIITNSTPVNTTKTKKTAEGIKLPSNSNLPITAVPSSMGKTFRVQIGAFNLKPIINNVPELSKVVLENGVTKYFSGNFTTYEQAAKHKKIMIENGFEGAFIVSFENGKIIK
jgi:hypothetical protein